ncbi:hypothetical protein ALC62_13395 [Cyphomyrmex costatus]|uniref:Uncharacterized protein n=1 Tax=Cyphomyrmex costatus TaxID=456900 RepID=A0A195C500_9HYME|nr:hypothetical protein ALC62_13395 [Cyphomyrmex costatus]
MPLCGAVTKLTRLSPNTNGCTLRTPAAAAAAPTVWGCLGGGIDSGRKESRKILGRGRLAPIHADAVVVGESLHIPTAGGWLVGWSVGLCVCVLPRCTYFQTSSAHRGAAMERFFQSLCARDILVINDAFLGGGDESPID